MGLLDFIFGSDLGPEIQGLPSRDWKCPVCGTGNALLTNRCTRCGTGIYIHHDGTYDIFE